MLEKRFVDPSKLCTWRRQASTSNTVPLRILNCFRSSSFHTKLSSTVALLVFHQATKTLTSSLSLFQYTHIPIYIFFKMKSAAIVAFAAAALVAPALAQDAASLAALLPSCAVSHLYVFKHLKHD